MDHARKIPRKILGYIAKDSPRKIRSYVRKHHIDLGECRTPAGASALHLAAELDSELCLRYLLKSYPCLVSIADHRDELPLHKAINSLLSKSQCPHDAAHISLDIIEPLLAAYPQASRLPNCDGRSPRDLLLGSGWFIKSGKLSRSLSSDDARMSPPKENSSGTQDDSGFYRKLFENMEEDYFTSHSDYYENDARETYDQWADRMYEERRRKRQQEFRRGESKHHRKDERETTEDSSATSGGGNNHSQRSSDLDSRNLKRSRPVQPSAIAKRARHEHAMRQVLLRPADAPPLGMADFPWPTGSSEIATAGDMVNLLLCDVDSADAAAVRSRAKELQKTWHPDKIEQKFGAMLLPTEKVAILDRVKEIAQILNAHMQRA